MKRTSSRSDQLEVCGRCNGRGTVTIRLGPPGTDRHTPAGKVKFTEVGTYTCDACLGTGWRRPRKERPPKGALHVHSTKADQMSFDDIFDAMKLPTKEEEPNAKRGATTGTKTNERRDDDMGAS